MDSVAVREEASRGRERGAAVALVPRRSDIEIREGQTSFHRIFDPLVLVPLIVVGGMAGAMILRGISRLTKQNGSASIRTRTIRAVI
jgi:hypothetical protein